jgi:hypothetical protein
VWTDISEELAASIFRAEKSEIEEPAWAGGCTLSHQSKKPNYHIHDRCIYTIIPNTQVYITVIISSYHAYCYCNFRWKFNGTFLHLLYKLHCYSLQINPSAWFAVTLTSRHLNRLLRFVVKLTSDCRHNFNRP